MTPAYCEPPTWLEAGTETITFSFEGTDVTCEVEGEAIAPTPTLTSLTYTGSLTNDQFVGSAPDLTGLTFTAHYSDSTLDQEVTPTSVLPSTYAEAGSATVTASYTDEYGTASVEISVTVVAVALDGLAISGSWTSDTQYVNRSVDTTGLTILAHYNDGTTDTLANAGLTFGGVKQNRGGNDYYSSNWMYEKSSDATPVTLYAADTNDVKYEGTSPNISILGEVTPPQTASATVYVGDAGDNLLGTFQNVCYGGYYGFYIDTDTFQPIEPSGTHPAFWYIISKADYDNDVLLGTAAQGLMTLMGDYGFDMTSDHNADWGPEGARVMTDFDCYMPTDGTGTLASDTDYMYVIARKDNATSGTSVATYKPSDLTELVKIVVSAKPGHAPTP